MFFRKGKKAWGGYSSEGVIWGGFSSEGVGWGGFPSEGVAGGDFLPKVPISFYSLLRHLTVTNRTFLLKLFGFHSTHTLANVANVRVALDTIILVCHNGLQAFWDTFLIGLGINIIDGVLFEVK